MKSLRVIVFACFRALLYPGSKIGVTAKGNSQANENFLTAFMQEIVYKYSPFMKWLYDKKLITSRETDKGYNVTFWNGSIIYFFPTISSSRGIHCDVLIGEELRLISKANWDSIAMPMLVQRRAGFRSRTAYQDRIDLDEETKVICITSNYTSRDWFNTMYKNTFTNYFKKTMSNNRVFSVDIFPAIRHGLKSVNWFYQQKKEMSEFSFHTEILNETVGEVEGAYFSLDLFRKNQVLKQAWYPLTNEEVSAGINKNRKKKNNEYRMIFVDFAWAGDNGTNINDQIVLGCMSLQFRNEKLYRNVEHIETYSGSKASDMPLKIKELFWDYQADYIVMDERTSSLIVIWEKNTLNCWEIVKPL